MNPSPLRWLRVGFLGVAWLVLAAAFALACAFVYLAPSLPTAENAQTMPLRVLTRSGSLISQIGEQRRIPVTYDEIPDLVREAVLAAEDDRFFQHHGIDWMGVARALVTNVVSADATGQGGSTITQQAARNMFLTLEQTARRKLSEVFVTYRMERDFSKNEILAIYLNVAGFGHRCVGIAAAAEYYYGKRLSELTLSQTATLVGVLPAPSKYNPVTNPKSAVVRRNYVLGRMLKLGYIDAGTAAAAQKESVFTRGYPARVDVEAPYVADMVVQEVVKLLGPAAVNAGYTVFTTIDGRLQAQANVAVRTGLMLYDRPHGYRGRLGKVTLPAKATAGVLDTLLEKFDSIGILEPAVVTKVGDKSAEVHIRYAGEARIDWEGLKWANPSRKGEKAANVVTAGDVVFVVVDKRGTLASLAQLPVAQAALVALDPIDGAIVSLVGGFDFYRSNFNRAVQAKRQPGSGFKPFIYSAALDFGLTAATVRNDAPVIDSDCNGEACWNPENSGGTYAGPMRLREALVRSRNPVAARIIKEIGVDTAIEHALKFGFNKDSLPRVESLALGVLPASPLEIVTGYAVFANGGFRVEPYFITRIEDSTGKVVFEAKPKIACVECEQTSAPAVDDALAVVAVTTDPVATETPAPPEVPAALAPPRHIRDVEAPPALREIARNQSQSGLDFLPADRLAPRTLSPQNAWIMSDIMHDVAVRGTGVKSNQLGRKDLAGKTGTSNDYRDNWFNGFNTRIVASVWMGFDDEKSLGPGEEGSKNALPIWMTYMKEALKNVPESRMERPGGLVDLRVSTTTGMLADQSDPTAVFETFMVEHLPKTPEGGVIGTGAGGTRSGGEPIF
ncbi:MAG: transglycosylase domain-containing protein [Pseudomonadota bacterium]